MVDLEAMGKIFEARRVALGKSITSVSHDTRLNVATIRRVELGQNNPSVKMLETLAAALGLEITIEINKKGA